MDKERRKALKYKLAPVLKPQMDQYMKTKKNIPVNEGDDLLSVIGDLDDTLMYTKNRKAELEWEDVSGEILDQAGAEYWADLGEVDLTYAINRARDIINKYNLEESKQNLNEMVSSSDITDTVTMDIPFLLRILEFAREGAGDDNTIHKVAERLIVGSKDFGILTMDDYEPIMNQFEAPESIGGNRLMQETDKLDYKMGYEAFQDGMKRNIHQSDKWLDGWDAAQDEAEQSSYYKLGENSKEYGEKISSRDVNLNMFNKSGFIAELRKKIKEQLKK